MHYLSTKNIFTPLFLFLSFIFLFHYSFVGQAVYGDGIYYYAYTRSLYKDFDIDFRNELGHHYSPQNNNSIIEEPLGEVPKATKTGMTPNKYPVGASLSWLFSFILLDTTAIILNYLQFPISILGYSDLYQTGIGILNISFVVFGLLILFKLLQEVFPKKIAVLGILTALFGSNLLYYGSWDVINSHPFSFFISNAFLYAWLRSREKRSNLQWFLLGLLIGILTLTRTQDGIFLIIPLLDVLLLNDVVFDKIKRLGILFIGTILALIPQLIVWQLLYGSYIVSPYIVSGEGFNVLSPHILGILFNERTGLVFWTPFYLLSYIGMFFMHNREVKYKFILFCTMQFLLISSWSGWTQGESFGVRMLISSIPFLTFGFATILNNLNKASILICLGLIVYNIAAIIYFLAVIHSPTYDLGKSTKPPIYQHLYKLLNNITHEKNN